MVTKPLIAVVLVFAATCASGVKATWADNQVTAVEATCVAKGENYLVHVLPRPVIPPFQFGLPDRYGVLNSNALVIHTSTETGKMQCLFISGDESARSLPAGMDWMFFGTTRLLGIVVSNGRIYLLTWSDHEAVELTVRPMQPPRFGKGQYDLSVFEATDGAKLASTLIEGELPESPPAEAYDHGPMQIEGDRVTVFNQVLRFDGERLTPTE